ncbi:sensor domain-containing diguanylate cyclase [Vibrio hippocampi]|uniref:diguanylate cyclase n=1 Tax=Vibrio hippocampi TaxID=654686 RepID=A0ABM8ZMC9_9VIBR|nr:diguanylate cyclase [Vibrio hippocampi]CAH0529463.1 hypothetical protein VHP8226_03232 [Vibrio hippocampi]
MSIRNKIITILLSIALTSHLVITTFYYLYAQNSITQQSVSHLESVASIQYQRLHAFIDGNIESLSLIQSRTQMRYSLDNYQRTGSADAYEMIDTILSDVLQQTSTINEIFIADTQGQVLFSTSALYNNRDFSQHPLFQDGLVGKTGSLLIKGDSEQVPAIVFSAPLVLKGKKLGVIAIQVQLDDFNAFFTDYTGLGQTGEVLLATLTNKGNLMLFTPLRFAPSPLLIPENSDSAIPMQQALNKTAKVFESALDYRNVPVVAVSRYFTDLGLGIVVKMDRDEVLSTNNELTNIFLYLIIFLVLVAILVSVVLANKIAGPIERITVAAKKISAGNLNQRVVVQSKDELGQLAVALNEMADGLVGAKLRLQEKVNQKTVELQRANQQLEHLSQTDALTGLYNRRYLDDQLDLEWSRCTRHHSTISLLMIDIDFFKPVNDKKGHLVGDDYLKTIAKALRDVFQRNEDIVARYGGEEFAAILTHSSQQQAMELGEVIRQRIEALGLESGCATLSPFVTVSVGVATCNPKCGEKPSKLIWEADRALYDSKALGRNRVTGFSRQLVSVTPNIGKQSRSH